jgi:cell division protein FtsA
MEAVMEDFVFALDIGTRSVVGIVGIPVKDKFEIQAVEIREHKKRAMLDGQVHDIEAVAGTVKEVKASLESKLGIKLEKVSIAAAGRVLKTKKVKVKRNYDTICEIDKDMVYSLEIEGVELAGQELDEELPDNEKGLYYCVGYTIISFYLNDYSISSLADHKGKSIGADVLATFLPYTVIESLYTVVEKSGLKVETLNLEPIAAINVAIPKDLRLLNLALVDIGAGTSDIAITKDGSVTAYSMVPYAGDEITEAICKKYLLDFNTAEKIKRELSTKKELKFKDVMGIRQVIKPAEIYDSIENEINNLAKTISDKIIENNGKSPNAVFLVGGGSRIKGLDKLIADYLKLPYKRVAVRGLEVIRNVKLKGKKLSGPEAITPIGIAVTSIIQKRTNFIDVKVNDRDIKLFNSKKLEVGDALVTYGFDARSIIGRNGKPLEFILNGNRKTIDGELLKPCKIFVNKKPSNIKTRIKSSDEIVIIPAVNGKDACITAGEIKNEFKSCSMLVNGKEADDDYSVKDGDNVETVNNINGDKKLSANDNSAGDAEGSNIKKTGAIAESAVDIVNEENSIDDNLDKPETAESSNNFNNESLKRPLNIQESAEDNSNKTDNGEIAVYINGRQIKLKGKDNYIFIDIFNYINIDTGKLNGPVALKLNGNKASYTDILKDGDKIEIGENC